MRDLFGKYEIEVVLIEEGVTPDHVDMVVAMGGDGTVLRALDRFPRCPVLAINFGTVGFLTAGDRTDLASIVKLLMDGRYIVSERLVLNCRYPGGEMHVVNEVMVRASYKLAFTDVFVDGAEIRDNGGRRYRWYADGEHGASALFWGTYCRSRCALYDPRWNK